MLQRYTATIPLLCCVLLSLLPSRLQARDYIDITADIRKIPTAVPYFIPKSTPRGSADNKIGRRLADLLGRALAFHGFITITNPERYDGRTDADWSALGVELVVTGAYQRTGEEVVLELRLFDVLENQVVFGRRYRGPWSHRTDMLFKFCDQVIEKLSGIAGCSQSRIAFVSDQNKAKEIFIADILGEEIQQITHHRYLAIAPRFTPDAAKLAYSSYHRGKQILYITTLGSQTTRAISWRQGLNMTPDWSPDGRFLALTLSKGINSNIYLTEPNSPPRKQVAIIRQLTRDNGINVSPSWSPDSKNIAFVSDRGGTPQIYIMEVATGKTRRLTYTGAYNTSPAWSPDGQYIAFAGQRGPTFHIFTIPVNGGEATQLTKTWGSHESPSWSPDSRQIVFSRKREDKQQICAIFKNGYGLRVLFRLPGRQSMPRWSPRITTR